MTPLTRVSCLLAAALTLVGALPEHARAIVISTGGIGVRIVTTAGLTPEQVSAYESQGHFRNFLGTPIGPHHFLTAQHIGIAPSDTITFPAGPNQGTWSILTWHDDPGSDLRIVEVDGTFNDWPMLYQIQDEVGHGIMVFGRGGAPNGTLMVDNEMKGWTVAAPDGLVGWAFNTVSATFGLSEIRADFNRFGGVALEAGFTTGDSAGAWFIEDASGELRLAGITFRASGPYQLDAGGSPDGNVFDAALLDRGGLWEGLPGSEIFVADNPLDAPAFGFASRVSTQINWIASIVPLGEIDSDGDMVPDSLDNCDFEPNPDQLDSGGIGAGSAPDGIGDACQCGDVSGDGLVFSNDGFFIKQFGLGLTPFFFDSPGNCDVTGDGECTGSDGALVNAIASGATSDLFGQNCDNARP